MHIIHAVYTSSYMFMTEFYLHWEVNKGTVLWSSHLSLSKHCETECSIASIKFHIVPIQDLMTCAFKNDLSKFSLFHSLNYLIKILLNVCILTHTFTMAFTLFSSRQHTFQQFSALPAQVWNSKRHAKTLNTDPDLIFASRITSRL